MNIRTRFILLCGLLRLGVDDVCIHATMTHDCFSLNSVLAYSCSLDTIKDLWYLCCNNLLHYNQYTLSFVHIAN